jgi:hypothetical protein
VPIEVASFDVRGPRLGCRRDGGVSGLDVSCVCSRARGLELLLRYVRNIQSIRRFRFLFFSSFLLLFSIKSGSEFSLIRTGVKANHRVVFDCGGVAQLAELMNNKELEYPVAGILFVFCFVPSGFVLLQFFFFVVYDFSHLRVAFWHMCESSFVCDELLSLGFLERLGELPQGSGTRKKTTGLVWFGLFCFVLGWFVLV